jgi:biopolymer transport protein ExbB
MHLSMSANRERVSIALLLVSTLLLAGGADEGPATGPDFEVVTQPARRLALRAISWYRQTPPADRITWGGLAAAAALGLGVVLERSARLRSNRIVPRDFAARFLGRLQNGQLDRGKALDFCEVNPSPAARVALGAVRRWGRPVADLERAVALAGRVESDRLRRNVATLRRVAALSPLLGLLGSLVAAGRALANLAPDPTASAWGPALASALSPLTGGVAIAILALVAYDGLMGRVETLVGALDRVGTETVDAIAMAAPVEGRTLGSPGRTPHQLRVEIPERPENRIGREDDLD